MHQLSFATENELVAAHNANMTSRTAAEWPVEIDIASDTELFVNEHRVAMNIAWHKP